MAKDSFDQTTLKFSQRVLTLIIYTVGIGSGPLLHIHEFQIIGHSLRAGAGILTIVGGLVSQQILGSIFSGFMIVYFRPFKSETRSRSITSTRASLRTLLFGKPSFETLKTTEWL